MDFALCYHPTLTRPISKIHTDLTSFSVSVWSTKSFPVKRYYEGGKDEIEDRIVEGS